MLVLAGCGGGAKVGDSDRPAGAEGLKAALKATRSARMQDAKLVLTRTDAGGEAEAFSLEGRLDPLAEEGSATLTVGAQLGEQLDLPKLKLEWDPNTISLDGGAPIARVKARSGNGGQVSAAADQMQSMVDLLEEAEEVGEAEPGVWTFNVVPRDAAGSGIAGGDAAKRQVWRGEARAGDGDRLKQISLQVPLDATGKAFNVYVLTLG